MIVPRHYEDLCVLHENLMPRRGYYIPASRPMGPLVADRDQSDRLQMLNGQWRFRYFDSIHDVPADVFLGDSLVDFIEAPVPSVWQNWGFDWHQYTNIRSPIPLDPPHVPQNNPAGAYLCEFDHTPDPDDVVGMHFTRLNRHYQPALHLARLVLRRTGLIDRVGGASASSFLLNMNDLFQDFVEDRLRRHMRGHLDVVAEPTEWLGHHRAVRMYPDLVLERSGVPVYVCDAKYKLTADGIGRNPDYYQLLAYLTAMNLDEGVLIYCLHDGEVPPRRVDVRHTDKRLFTYALDLSGRVDEVETALRELARWARGRVAQERAATAA